MTLKEKLDHHYKSFDKSKIIPDPLQFLHLYSNENDIEIVGLISSIFAYGNVKQIINSLSEVTNILGEEPHQFVVEFPKHKSNNIFKGIKHRFFTEEDILQLIKTLSIVLNEYGSIKKLFLSKYDGGRKNLKEDISNFSNQMLLLAEKFSKNQKISHGVKFMFPDPYRGSACKRMNLFLRWLIRKDDLDFGLWHEIPPYKLVMPVDTHVAQICKRWKLTKRKSVSWVMAEEITESLKKLDPVDPVKYDFAVSHIGMRKLSF